MPEPSVPDQCASRARDGDPSTARSEGADVHRAALVEGMLAGRHVLVVDDMAVNLEIADALLTQKGAWVSTATHGQEALDVLRKQPGACDLVLMDIRMPVMDGLTATRLIRDELGLTALPIIALTAEDRRLLAREAAAAGIDAVMEKPLSMHQLAICLAEVGARNLRPDPDTP